MDSNSIDKQRRPISFGMPTLMELTTLETLISSCKNIGFDFIELNANFPPYIRESLSRNHTLERLDEAGIDYSIHLPETLDFGSFQSESRDSALSMIASLCEMVKPETRFICHTNSGINVRLPKESVFLYEKYEHIYLDGLEETTLAISTILEESGCKLCMENLGNFNIPFIKKGLEIMLSSQSIGLTWDFGHDTTAHLVDSPFFENYLDKVLEIHLHDSKEGVDHLALYTGDTDIQRALSYAQERSLPVVVEVKSLEGLQSSYQQLAKRGYMGL